MTLGALIGATYQLVTIFMQYYKYDVTVSKTFTYQRQVLFPAVTFCNMNPVKKTAASKNPQLSTLTSKQETRKRRQALGNDSNDVTKSTSQIRLRHKRASRLGILI